MLDLAFIPAARCRAPSSRDLCSYAMVVATSATGGSFKLLGNACPCPTNNLSSINGTAPAAPPAPTT